MCVSIRACSIYIGKTSHCRCYTKVPLNKHYLTFLFCMLYKQSYYRTNILHCSKISFLQTYLAQSTWKKKRLFCIWHSDSQLPSFQTYWLSVEVPTENANFNYKNEPFLLPCCLGNNSCPIPFVTKDPKEFFIRLIQPPTGLRSVSVKLKECNFCLTNNII